MTGTVKALRLDRGFGFLSDGVNRDVFFHCSQVANAAIEDLTIGARVEFELDIRRGRTQAINVRAL